MRKSLRSSLSVQNEEVFYSRGSGVVALLAKGGGSSNLGGSNTIPF